jgi:hypothetical protein
MSNHDPYSDSESTAPGGWKREAWGKPGLASNHRLHMLVNPLSSTYKTKSLGGQAGIQPFKTKNWLCTQ